ncbi:MAG TPA: NAD(P)-dependent oxidoreductase [Acidimicrobiales bacterium]|nr:NAD(P)-dependent oxidoreductase [Acidimicrobiales bacterium]
MKVFVAGATGVLGRRAVALLLGAGHEVTGVARSPEREAMLRRIGAHPVTVDIFDVDALRPAVAGHDVVCNLATHIPPTTRMALPSAWSENDRIRSLGSRNLVDAALAAEATRFVQESIGFVYEDAGDEWIDESAPVDPVANLHSATEAEANTERFGEGGGVGVVLRFAAFYGPDSETTLTTIRLARRRIAAMPGRRVFISSISTDDAASAVVASLGASGGVYNVGDNDPVRRGEYFGTLADALGVKPPRVAPLWLVKLGGRRAGYLGRSQRLSNRRFVEATGWTPTHPSVREGWPATVAAVGAAAS